MDIKQQRIPYGVRLLFSLFMSQQNILNLDHKKGGTLWLEWMQVRNEISIHSAFILVIGKTDNWQLSF